MVLVIIRFYHNAVVAFRSHCRGFVSNRSCFEEKKLHLLKFWKFFTVKIFLENHSLFVMGISRPPGVI